MKDISITKLSTISLLSGGERIPVSQAVPIHNNRLETLYTTPSDISSFLLSYDVFEVGAVWPYAVPITISNPVPTGWLLCDGAELTVDNYRKLYAVIGNTYGSSSPGASFKLPNMQGRFLMGYCTTAPTYIPYNSGLSLAVGSTGGIYNASLDANQMPSHVHEITADATLTAGNAGAFFLHYPETVPNDGRIEQQQEGAPDGPQSSSYNVTLNVNVTPTVQSVGGNQIHNNTPPYICMNYIIKT